MAERVTSETLHTERAIRTFTGKYVDVFDPKEDMIDIVDIAHALSMLNRKNTSVGITLRQLGEITLR